MTMVVQLRFPTHRVHLVHDEDTGAIWCFKHDASYCDCDIFHDYDAASDWIMTPLPSIVYRVTISGDDQE
jgi:hypothetical protein